MILVLVAPLAAGLGFAFGWGGGLTPVAGSFPTPIAVPTPNPVIETAGAECLLPSAVSLPPDTTLVGLPGGVEPNLPLASPVVAADPVCVVGAVAAGGTVVFLVDSAADVCWVDPQTIFCDGVVKDQTRPPLDARSLLLVLPGTRLITPVEGSTVRVEGQPERARDVARVSLPGVSLPVAAIVIADSAGIEILAEAP